MSSREEFKRQLLAMSYKDLVLEYKSLKNIYDHYESMVKHGLVKDITKDELGEIVKLYKEVIREKERAILRDAFLRGRV